ncbi:MULTISPECIES: hypothetical protein [Acinetobacter calcoaceticus/baumannii complex]|uniref:hypothetical protein n=1 Tax=Acinetobacter calcoaceticus/baumannii complex TaxID=909768 RepID=UPI001580E414|nr:hypothetical protein [Acinetobacter lactucae]NUF39475.1 hypothetical protein [Acinetobacter lactucae]
MQLKNTSSLVIESKSSNNQASFDRLDQGKATYEDLTDAFARELTTEEIALVSGANTLKTGVHYCGGVMYVC